MATGIEIGFRESYPGGGLEQHLRPVASDQRSESGDVALGQHAVRGLEAVKHRGCVLDTAQFAEESGGWPNRKTPSELR
jgi:hypothetical protein